MGIKFVCFLNSCISVKLQNFDFDEMLGKVWGLSLDWIYIGVLLLLDLDS